MNLWQLSILWLGSWIFIIILNIINHAQSNNDYITKNIEKEIVSDGNNLFKTGLIYYLGNTLCYFLDFQILHWVLMISGIAFCLLPIISLFGLIKNIFAVSRMSKKYWLSFFSAVLCNVTPLIMAINIYFEYIK